MKKLVPFLIASAGVFAALGILFLLIRTDALPARVRALDWRRVVDSPAAHETEPVAKTEPAEEA